MRKPPVQFDTATAMAYVGQTVLLELIMDEDEPPYWCCMHILGLVLTKDGVWDFPYFMTKSLTPNGRTPSEVPFNDILTIRTLPVIRSRGQSTSGKVLSRLSMPHLQGKAELMDGGCSHA